MRSSALRAAGAVALIGVLASGCGSSSSSTAPKPKKQLLITIESFGAQTQVSTPPSISAGVVQMKFENKAKGKHSAQIIRIDPGHDAMSALKAANAWGQGGSPLPGWIHLNGGFGGAKPGQTLPGVGKFVPGSYAVVDLEAKGKPVYGTFAVKGKESKDPLPSSPSTVTAVDYSFTAKGLRAGASLLFRNNGKEPHQISAAKLQKGATLADVKRYLKKQKGRSPVDETTGVDGAVLDGGASQVTTLGLTKPGTYALLCFVPDRKGGPPHALRGMIGTAVVR